MAATGSHHVQSTAEAEALERAGRSANASRVCAKAAANAIRTAEVYELSDAIEILEQASSYAERAQQRLGR
jgi:hypothetical protein